jgi:hypothetical protein
MQKPSRFPKRKETKDRTMPAHPEIIPNLETWE